MATKYLKLTPLVLEYIKSSIKAKATFTEIYTTITVNFKLNVCRRTVWLWISRVDYQKQIDKDNELMAKWRKEYDQPEIVSEEERLLDEMYFKAKGIHS